MKLWILLVSLSAANLPAVAAFAQDAPSPLAPLPAAPPTDGEAPPPVALTPSNTVRVAPARVVWAHVDSSRTTMLQYLPPFETRWTEMCFSPCDSFIPLDGTYRIIAPGIVGSHEIELEAAPGEKVVLDIHARTLAQHRTAENLVIGSYVAGGVGLACEVGAFTVNTEPAQTALLVSGVGVAAVGLALVITSFALGQATGVSQTVSGPASVPAAPTPTAAEGLAAPRFGSLADGREVRGPALPVGTSFPFLRLAF